MIEIQILYESFFLMLEIVNMATIKYLGLSGKFKVVKNHITGNQGEKYCILMLVYWVVMPCEHVGRYLYLQKNTTSILGAG
jgi:hypothetical protein